MCRFDFNTAFTDDRRAVTPVIGFILLFGILVLLLTMYQAQVVPQQNAQVEFQHYQEVQDNLIKLRNSISTAGQADTSKFTRVTLGTTYQTRVATINPVAPAGTLRTSDPYNITVENETVSKNISTRFLEYEPRYNEITAGSIWYEHSVLYVDERDRGTVRILEDQNLVTNRSTKLRLTAVQNEFEETGTQRTIIEIYPTENINESDLPDGELNITMPTRLNKSEYWGGQFDTDVDIVENHHDTDVHKLDLSNLSISSNNFKFNTVGIREKPIADQPNQNVGPSSQRGSGSDNDGDDGGNGNGDSQTVSEDTDGDVFSTGNLIIEEDIFVEGNVEADGSVTLEEGAEIEGSITSGGDVNLGEDSEIEGDIEAGGSVTLGKDAEVEGGITSGGDVNLGEGSKVGGDIEADGSVILGEDAEVEGDVFVELRENIVCGDNSTINGQSCEEYANENY